MFSVSIYLPFENRNPIANIVRALAPGGYLEIKDVSFAPQTFHKQLPESSMFKTWSGLMIDGAKRFGRDLMAMTHMKKMIDRAGFIDTVEIINEWPLHAQNEESEAFAEMVRTNFREEIQGLSLGLLSETKLPEEVELILAKLRQEAKNEDLQIFWPA
jgi:hypothetical protein